MKATINEVNNGALLAHIKRELYGTAKARNMDFVESIVRTVFQETEGGGYLKLVDLERITGVPAGDLKEYLTGHRPMTVDIANQILCPFNLTLGIVQIEETQPEIPFELF